MVDPDRKRSTKYLQGSGPWWIRTLVLGEPYFLDFHACDQAKQEGKGSHLQGTQYRERAGANIVMPPEHENRLPSWRSGLDVHCLAPNFICLWST